MTCLQQATGGNHRLPEQPATAALYGLVLFPRGPGTGIELLAATTEMLVGRSERSTFLIGSMYLVKL